MTRPGDAPAPVRPLTFLQSAALYGGAPRREYEDDRIGEHGWRYPFALYGLGAVLALGMAFSRPEPEVRAIRVSAEPAAATAPRVSLGERLRALSWFPFHYTPFAFLICSIVFLPNIYLPFRLRDYGATPLNCRTC